MRLSSRGRFARVCVEVDLTKLLKSGYRLRGETHPLQYEGASLFMFYVRKVWV